MSWAPPPGHPCEGHGCDGCGTCRAGNCCGQMAGGTTVTAYAYASVSQNNTNHSSDRAEADQLTADLMERSERAGTETLAEKLSSAARLQPAGSPMSLPVGQVQEALALGAPSLAERMLLAERQLLPVKKHTSPPLKQLEPPSP